LAIQFAGEESAVEEDEIVAEDEAAPDVESEASA
jgi:hypothetical protein